MSDNFRTPNFAILSIMCYGFPMLSFLILSFKCVIDFDKNPKLCISHLRVGEVSSIDNVLNVKLCVNESHDHELGSYSFCILYI